MIAYNIAFLYRLFCFTFISQVGQQSKVPTRVSLVHQPWDSTSLKHSCCNAAVMRVDRLYASNGGVTQTTLESDRGINGATQSAIGDLRGLSSLNWVWGGAPVANGFRRYLFEWSSFSSTVHLVRKNAHVARITKADFQIWP